MKEIKHELCLSNDISHVFSKRTFAFSSFCHLLKQQETAKTDCQSVKEPASISNGHAGGILLERCQYYKLST